MPLARSKRRRAPVQLPLPTLPNNPPFIAPDPSLPNIPEPIPGIGDPTTFPPMPPLDPRLPNMPPLWPLLPWILPHYPVEDDFGNLVFAADTTPAGRILTEHSKESLVRHGYREPFADVDRVIDNANRVRRQLYDNAAVYIQRVGGRNRKYDVVIVNDNDPSGEVIITGLRNLTPRELQNLGRNNGFDPNP